MLIPSGCWNEACLHWSLVHEHAIQIFGSLDGRIWFGEDDSGDAEAASTLVVSHQYPFDLTNRFGEVFLCAIGS
jgi:hypothetical protein